MKNFNFIYPSAALRLAMVLTGSTLLLNACKDPIKDVTVVVKTESLSKSPTLVKFVKANPEGPEIPASFAVTISGPGKEFVQADDGGKTFVATQGLLAITLTRFAKPTETNPVVFTVSANVEGYAPISTLVSIRSEEEEMKVQLPMLAYAAPAKGTAVVQTEKPLNAGVTATEVTIATTPSASTPQALTITIPSGTQMLDVNKQPINASNLKASVVYYGTTQTEGLQATSDLILATNPIVGNKQLNGEALLLNAGIASIIMTAGDKPVKHFSKPVTVEMGIDPEMLNPVTGQLIKAGDVLPIWSRNEETGQHTYEGSTVVVNTGGKLSVTMTINHLSDWMATLRTADDRLEELRKLGILLAEPKPFEPLPNLFLDFEPFDWSFPLRSKWWVPDFAYDNLWWNISAFDFGHGYHRFTDIDMSSYNWHIPSWSSTTMTNLIDVEINASATCPNNKMAVKPDDTWLVIKNVTENVTTEQVVKDGKLKIKLKDGHEYSLTAIYDGKTYSSPTMKIDKNTNPNYSNSSLTVKGSYVDNVMVINAVYQLTSCK